MKQLNYNLGAKVHCKDGQCGTLSKLVVDPHTQQITDIIVEKGFLMTTDTVLPIALVKDTTNEQLILTIHSDDLSNYPLYNVTEFEEPTEIPGQHPLDVIGPNGLQTTELAPVPMVKRKVQQGIEAGFKVIKEGSPVHSPDGVIGKIDSVITDPITGKVTHIIVRRGLIVSALTIIPIAVVDTIYNDGISILATEEEIEQFPQHDPLKDILK